MGKKGKKTDEHKARVAAKQTKKTAQKEKRSKAKGKDADSDAEDADLDAILAQYAEEQAKFLKVTEVPSEPPVPRSSATVLASPSNRNELLLYGGEYFDGTHASFFNNLFVYLIDRGEWREVTSPNSPLPRSGHAWCRGGNTGGIYMFGGEFSSPKQGTFYHYNDFWHLDTTTREWTRLESKGKGPPARSGHRMTYFKNYIILFGGFQDTSQQTKYLQDLWIYDCNQYTWTNPTPALSSQKPDPRSSFSFLPHETGAVIYGGYSRVKASTGGGGGGGKQGKGGPQKMALRPMVHQDTWFLRITPPTSEAPSSTGPVIRWERRKKPANTPNPPRVGTTMAYHKGRGIMFGGVHDVELTEEGIDSEFFDTMFAWNTDRNRFFPLTLRRPRAPGKKQQANQNAKGKNRGKADEEELLANLKALEAKVGIRGEDDDEEMQSTPQPEEPTEPEKPSVVRFEMPHRRFNAQLAVQDDTLFIFGGTFEKGDREFTFDDMYSIDLVKMDGVKEIFYREPENWNLLNEADDSDEDMEDDEDDDMDEDEDEADAEAMSVDAASPAPADTNVPSVTKDMEQLDVEEPEEQNVNDSRPLPRPFESLREFFSRTSEEWQNIMMEIARESTNASEKTVKELRKAAFSVAEERWWDSREEIMALEDEQEAAGIGEVVSMSDRTENMGGAGRRR